MQHFKGNLDFLEYVNDRSFQDLPSWVPDWSTSGTLGNNREAQINRQKNAFKRYHASNRSASTKVNNQCELSVEAIRVDVVSKLSVREANYSKLATVIESWRAIARADHEDNSRYVCGGYFLDAFIRTMIGDTVCSPRIKTSRITWWKQDPAQSDIEDWETWYQNPGNPRHPSHTRDLRWEKILRSTQNVTKVANIS
ncbi:hypothetical protein AOQ84DRAFT_383992 [Glonium stellatum]|uniref:Uncharacterized protein n=1 Tax=Glonium stellatum TaxID=574774 RepID=A0A8E2EM98_9PEZI|nr:hypothetical protein AOQ84DRAFT_383992 [Glonium stellatum]